MSPRAAAAAAAAAVSDGPAGPPAAEPRADPPAAFGRVPGPGPSFPPEPAPPAPAPAPAAAVPTTEDLTRPEISCRALKPALIYLERLFGRDDLIRLVRSTGLEPAYVENENNWISFAYELRFFEALVERTGNPRAIYDSGIYAASKEAYGSVFYFLLSFGSPSLVYRKFVEIAPLVVKIGKYELDHLEPGRARLRYRVHAPHRQHRLNCDAIRGQLASVPTVWGLPAAVIEEVECQANGADACVYDVRWVERPPRVRTFLGAAVGVLLALVAAIAFAESPDGGVLRILATAGLAVCGYLAARSLDMGVRVRRENEESQGRSAALLASLEALETKYRELRAAHDEIHEQARRLAALNRIGLTLTRSLQLDALLEKILRATVDDLGFARSALFLLDEERGVLAFRGGLHVPGPAALRLRQVEVPSGAAGALNRCCATGGLIFGGRPGEPETPVEAPLAEMLGREPYVIAPLKSNEQVIGALVLVGARPLGNVRGDEDLFGALTNQVAVAIGNAVAYEAVESILGSLPLPVAIVDREERVEYANQAFVRLLGREAKDVLGLPVCEAAPLYGGQAKRLRAQARSVHRRKGPRDGEMDVGGRTFEYRLFLLSRTAGMRHRVGIVLKDATRDRDYRKLVQAEKLAGVGTLASGVAHEINNPLAAILSLAELIEDGATDPLETRSHARKIVEYSTMAARIVRELGSYSRQAPGDGEGAVDLNDAIHGAIRLGRHGTELDGTTFELDLAPDLPPLRGSAVEIQQAFLNLIINAAHATEGRGRIRIDTARAGDEVVARVEDSGPGIPEHVLPRIFEPFYTTKEKGSGLGLYVVYRIVTKYGGDIVAESARGSGAKFIMRFPAGGAGG